MKNIIFHFPHKINKNYISGTMIRPLRMKEAFENIGYNVFFIDGFSMDRIIAIKKIKQLIKNNYKFEFLYSESVNCPTTVSDNDHLPRHPFLDFNFFSYLKSKKIPIGLFYRDIFWKFKTYKKEVKLWKKIISIPLFYYDLIQYNRLIDRLFIPSKSMEPYLPSYFNKNKICLLPPGGIIENRNYNNKAEKLFTILYIGNVTLPEYDISIIFRIANFLLHSNIKFVISCPKDSWIKYSKYYLKDSGGKFPKNVKIVHFLPDENNKLFAEATLFIAIIKDKYSRITSPMKLYESICNGVPILILESEVSEAGNLIRKENIGWVTNYSLEGTLRLINYLNNNRLEIKNKRLNILKIQNKHTWNSRAKFVSKVLSKGSELK